MTDIPEDEFNNIVREKAVIDALTENRWLVEVGDNLFSLFEDSSWIDEETRQEMEELKAYTDNVLDELELEDGYDVQKILNMDAQDQIALRNTLNHNTEEALNYTQSLLQRVEGQHDAIERLPEIVQSSVDEAFENYLDGDDFSRTIDIDLNYDDVASELEQNIDYDQLAPEIDTSNLAAVIAADIGIDETVIATELDIDEELIASYIDENAIAAGIDESEIGRHISVQTEFNGTVYVDPDDIEQAVNQADIQVNVDSEVNLDENDYKRIGREVSPYIDTDLDENDYERIGQEVANNIDIDIDCPYPDGEDSGNDPDSGSGGSDDTYGRGFANAADSDKKNRRGFLRDVGIALSSAASLGALGAGSWLIYEETDGKNSNGSAPTTTTEPTTTNPPITSTRASWEPYMDVFNGYEDCYSDEQIETLAKQLEDDSAGAEPDKLVAEYDEDNDIIVRLESGPEVATYSTPNC